MNRYKEIEIRVLNGLYWKVIESCKEFKHGRIIFKNLARNILCSPIFLLKDSTLIAGIPFLIQKNGKYQYYEANPQKSISINLDVSRFVFKSSHIICKIIYWNIKSQRWLDTRSVRQLTINQDSLRKNKAHQFIKFDNVPADALYRIVDVNQNVNDRTCGRPFIYNDELKRYIDY